MFIPVQLATLRGSEEGQLVMVDEALAAVLVRILPEPNERPEEGWFLQVGFGPCNREGLIFPTLEAAAAWTLAQFAAHNPPLFTKSGNHAPFGGYRNS